MNPRDAPPDAAENLPRNRARARGNLEHADPLLALRADHHDLLARLDRAAVGHVGNRQIHRDRADQRRSAFADEDLTTARERAWKAVLVADRERRETGGAGGGPRPCVSDPRSRGDSLNAQDARL